MSSGAAADFGDDFGDAERLTAVPAPMMSSGCAIKESHRHEQESHKVGTKGTVFESETPRPAARGLSVVDASPEHARAGETRACSTLSESRVPPTASCTLFAR